MPVAHGKALRWIGCGIGTDNFANSHLVWRFLLMQKRSDRTGLADFPSPRLCLSVDICVNLWFCFFPATCRAGRGRGVARKSKGKHRYTQISTNKHRWPSGRFAWPRAQQGMAFGMTLVGPAQFRRVVS